MTKNKLLENVNAITNGERFISYSQLKEIKELEYAFVDNCGSSGTGKGTLYTVYLLDDNGNKMDEVCEVVVKKEGET